MKPIALILVTTGWLLWVASFFLPWYEFLGLINGGTVVRELMFSMSREVAALTLLLWLSIVCMAVTPIALLSSWALPWKALPLLMLVATLLNLAVLVNYATEAPNPLRLGYYLWCAALILVSCGLYLSVRTRSRMRPNGLHAK
jgi:hypothetical protein